MSIPGGKKPAEASSPSGNPPRMTGGTGLAARKTGPTGPASGFLQSPGTITAVLLLPAAVVLGLCFFLPLAQLLLISLSGEEGPFSAYSAILSDEVFRAVFLSTLKMALVVTAIAILLGYPAAYLLTRLRGIRLSIALYCVLVPFWISVLVRSFSWILLLERNGPVNTLLVTASVIERPVQLLFNDFSLYVGMVHVLLPYAILPIYTAMLKVDQRLLLASNGLGASDVQTFLRVYLPLTAGGTAAAALFVFLMALGFYITPALLGGLHNLTVAMLIDNLINERLVWPLAAAASFILLVTILAFLLVTSRFVSLGRITDVR